MRKASRVLAGVASLVALSPLERTAQAQPSFPTDGLVRYYNFDEGQGTIAKDLTGAQNLSVSDSWTLQGKLNAAYNPNGNGYNTTHNPLGQDEVSLNFWIKKTGTWAPYTDIIGTGNTPQGSFYVDAYADTLLFYLSSGNAPSLYFPNNENYHMVTLTMKDGEQKGYLDGTPLFTRNLPYSFSGSPVKLFGGIGGAPNNVMNIDEVAVWRSYLSFNDISALYNNGQGLSCPLPEPYTIALTVGGAALLAPRRRKSN